MYQERVNTEKIVKASAALKNIFKTVYRLVALSASQWKKYPKLVPDTKSSNKYALMITITVSIYLWLKTILQSSFSFTLLI